MKNLKKVLALALACVMVFGLAVSAAGTGYPDVAEDATYAEAVKTLSALGIIKGDENGNFNPDATITRAEMAKILCTMVNSGDLAETATKFTDVPATHWASGYVNYAQQLGYIDGYDATTFGPEDPVTYEQVLKLVMAALGYTYKAQENGGYPTGYLFVAADAEVTKGAAGKGPEAAPRSTVAVVVNNAMNTPLMERTSYGTESVWEEMDGTGTKAFKTLLTQKHKTYKVEGKVTNSYKQDADKKDGYVDTEITKTLKIDVENVLGATPVRNELNAIQYYTLRNIDAAGTDAADLLGYESVMYFKELDSGDIALIAIARKSVKNKEIVISDVTQVFDPAKDSSVRENDKPTLTGTDTSDKKIFSYWNDRDTDSRITTVEIDPNAYIIWNNRTQEKVMERYSDILSNNPSLTPLQATLATLVPARGSITLVDTGNTGTYDLIRVTAYDVATVDAINPNNNRINFKSERTMTRGYISLNTDAYPNLKEYNITDASGKAMEVKDLKEFDVLNIATNDWSDPTYFDIVVTREVVTGKVTKVNTRNETVTVDGRDLKITTGVASLELPELDDEGNFYLDAEGKIAFVDTSVGILNGNYAYICQINDGMWNNYVMRMYTKDGGDKKLDIAKNIKINEVRKSTLDDQYNWADIADIYSKNYITVAKERGLEVTDETTSAQAKAMLAAIPVNASDLFTSPAYSGEGGALTPLTFLKNMAIGGNKGEASALKSDYAFTGNAAADRLVTYTAGDEVTGITFAIPSTSNKVFGFVGDNAEGVEWQSSLNKFKGGKGLPENAAIFFVNPNDEIVDYSVKTIADLTDGNDYSPYYFQNTDNGPSVVLLLETTAIINPSQSLAIFDDYGSTTDEDGDNVFSVDYWVDGALAETPLIVSGDLDKVVMGMNKGDAFLFAKDDKGQVTDIEVIFTPGTEPIEPGTSFKSFVDISGFVYNDENKDDDFQFLGDKGSADNEVYFGYVAKVATRTDGVRVTLLDETGVFGSAQQDLNIGKDAKVIKYNAANSEKKMLMEAEGGVSDIVASFYTKDAEGNMDLETSDMDQMSYAFVRVYKDEVREVIYVRYAREN